MIEIKTWFDDLGAVERQLDWYVREAPSIVRAYGIRPRRTVGWLLMLATADVEESIRSNRDVVNRRFPIRAHAMRGVVNGDDVDADHDGIALIDPRSRRHAWLIPSRLDGRRSAAPYADYAAAARAMSA